MYFFEKWDLQLSFRLFARASNKINGTLIIQDGASKKNKISKITSSADISLLPLFCRSQLIYTGKLQMTQNYQTHPFHPKQLRSF
jgi:hypothetical protein